MKNRYHERIIATAVNHLTDDVRALVAVEKTRQHLNLIIRLEWHAG
jgi:hypothetical protein